MAVTEASRAASRAVDDLYRRHRGEVYRYAYAVIGNHADAEDVTQTTFLNAYRALEQGVHPRMPSNWLLTIASNAIKQRFREEKARPRQIELDEHIASSESRNDGPSIGELLSALSKIPPQQRQAIILREFEGRPYREIADILGATTSALETLLFRARRSLTRELEQQLTCTEAQFAVSKAVDGRLGRKDRRLLRDHLAECPDCAHFARAQPRHRSALRGLLLVPIPLTLPLFKSLEGAGTATAATFSLTASDGAGTAAHSAGATLRFGTAGTAQGSAVAGAGGVTVKVAAVVAAVTITGGVAVTGVIDFGKPRSGAMAASNAGRRLADTTNGPTPTRHPAPDRMRRSTTATPTLPQTPAAQRLGATTDVPALEPTRERPESDQSTQPTQHAGEPPGGAQPPESVPQPEPTQPEGTQPSGTQAQVPGQTRSSTSKAKKPKKWAKPGKPLHPSKRKADKHAKAERQPKASKPEPAQTPKPGQEPKSERPTTGMTSSGSSAANSKPTNGNAGRPKP
jgi:RNA polymerase sigma factor (sigma-70 family)